MTSRAPSELHTARCQNCGAEFIVYKAWDGDFCRRPACQRKAERAAICTEEMRVEKRARERHYSEAYRAKALKLLEYLKEYRAMFGKTPSYTTIAGQYGGYTMSTISDAMTFLAKEGKIRRVGATFRDIEILEAE